MRVDRTVKQLRDRILVYKTLIRLCSLIYLFFINNRV